MFEPSRSKAWVVSVAGLLLACQDGGGGADVCLPNPCQGGAACVAEAAGFRCECPVGLTGATCEAGVDHCTPDRCENGGTCVNEVDGFTCQCPAGFEGNTCAYPTSACVSNPCLNGGTCVDQVGGFTCECPAGFDGSSCEHDIDDCTPNPCQGATCVDGVAGFVCLPPGSTPNQPPQCVAIPNQNATQGAPFALALADFCSDPEGAGLVYAATNLVNHGLGLDPATGEVSGAPNATARADSPFSVVVSATDSLGARVSVTFQVSVSAAATGGGDVFRITPGGPTAFNCATLAGCGPGDSFVFQAGLHDNRTYLFSNLRGTAANPIIIRNDTAGSSRVVIQPPAGRPRAAIKCANCEYVTITGLGGWSGQPAQRCGMAVNRNGVQDQGEVAVDEYQGQGCGIFIDGSVHGAAQDAVLLQGWPRSHVITQGLEMKGDWSGPGDATYTEAHAVNFNDKAVCENAPGVGDMDGNQVRHNYMHHFNDTALYLGANVTFTCNGANEPNQKNLLIEYNIWDTIGEGGAKIKHVEGADAGAAIIRYNTGRNGGGSKELPATGHNSVAFSCFEASCEAYGNIFDTTVNDGKTGPGLGCNLLHRPTAWGDQVCDFHDNLIRNTSGTGINTSRAATSTKSGSSKPTAGQRVHIDNNTVVDAARESGSCIAASTATLASTERNNVCAGSQRGISGGSNVTQQGNLGDSVANLKFVNAAARDFRLQSTSPARNSGQASGCRATDLLGAPRPRPVGGACDKGAYEFSE